MMLNTTVSSKGQVVIPKEVRESHGWAPGTLLTIEDQGDGILLRPVPAFPPTTVDDLLGCLPYAGKAKSLEEMDAGIAEGARDHGRERAPEPGRAVGARHSR
jgi:AbrB family looped-hinge helix DNA binding protein